MTEALEERAAVVAYLEELAALMSEPRLLNVAAYIRRGDHRTHDPIIGVPE